MGGPSNMLGISVRAAEPSDLKYFDHRLSVSACGTPAF